MEIQNVSKWFPIRKGIFSRVSGYVKAVNEVSFSIQPGETLGLVGESGCGKSTLAKMILQLLKPTSGHVLFEGADLTALPQAKMKNVRKNLQMIFQDPFSSLNPRMTVGDILAEALLVHHMVPKAEVGDRVARLLKTVGLNTFHARRYPHEFSSGQRQRIGIARALSVDPHVIVCDEPVSALDVSIQAQILNLLMELEKKYALTYLFISHDLNVVRHISSRIAVMYLGSIVEIGDAASVADEKRHPYTKALLDSAPVPNPAVQHHRVILHGDVPNPAAIPPGCAFHTRCPSVFEACRNVQPHLAECAPGHSVRCLLYEECWPGQTTMHMYQRQDITVTSSGE